MQLKQDIEWSFNDKDDAKDSTQLYCCKFSNDFGKFFLLEVIKLTMLKFLIGVVKVWLLLIS